MDFPSILPCKFENLIIANAASYFEFYLYDILVGWQLFKPNDRKKEEEEAGIACLYLLSIQLFFSKIFHERLESKRLKTIPPG